MQFNVGRPFVRNGNKYMMCLKVYFTKLMEVCTIPNQEAIIVADVFIKQFICRFKVLLEIHSKLNRNFEIQLFLGICDRLGIKKTTAPTDRWNGSL